MTILVTGGTGTLGKPTVELLRAAGHDVRVLSRTPTPGNYCGNLTTGEGLAEAFSDVDTVLHLATTAKSADVTQARNLVDASRAAGLEHLVFISIVGVDVLPSSYYRAKLASEALIIESGIPFTVLRATQFHEFIRLLVHLQRRLPLILSVNVPVQPIAASEVAERLFQLVEAGPSGRVADAGGPEQLPVRTAIDQWQEAAGTRKPVVTLRLPLPLLRAMRAGKHMTPLPGFGRQTFADFAESAVRA